MTTPTTNDQNSDGPTSEGESDASINEVFSWPSLLARFEDDRDLIQELVGLFRDETVTHVAELDRATAEGDASAVLRAAHSLRGAASNFETPPVVGLLFRVEEAAKRGATDEASVIVPELKLLLNRLLRQLEHRLKG